MSGTNVEGDSIIGAVKLSIGHLVTHGDRELCGACCRRLYPIWFMAGGSVSLGVTKIWGRNVAAEPPSVGNEESFELETVSLPDMDA
jgi:hypothetical protein